MTLTKWRLKMAKFKLAIPILIMCLSSIAMTAETATLPKVGSIWTNHISGRQVKLSWYHVNTGSEQALYDVYRDNVRIATITGKEKDPETNGNIWFGDVSYQYFYDNTAWPGSKHIYEIVVRTASGKFSEAASKDFTVPLPAIGNIWATYHTGRKVQLQWYNVSGSFFAVNYNIYRDGEKIASFKAGVAGTGSKGDSWKSDTSYQYYTDSGAFPGKAHKYRIVATLFEGFDIEATRDFSIPVASVGNIWATNQTGRKVQLQWFNITGSFFDVNYTIYRDDEKIASFKAGVAETGSKGDSWKSDASYQYYTDSGAFPGITHKYKIVATLFEGFDIEATKDVAVPAKAIGTIWTTYQTGRKVQLQWYHITGSFFDVNYTIYRDGDKIASFKAGAVETGSKGDSWKSDASYQYYTDSGAFPGRTHKYRIVATLFEGFDIEATKDISIPEKAIGTIWTTYQTGRKVQLQWYNISGSFFNVNYTIYRDGEKIASFKAGVAETGSKGDSWRSDASYQYYIDVTATPGKNHIYRIVATLFDETQIDAEKEIKIPSPSLQLYQSQASGQKAEIYWKLITDFEPGIYYQIYRDNVKIASIKGNSNGDNGNGSFWRFQNSYQYFTDATVIPGKIYTYQVRPILFEGYDGDLSAEKTIATPVPTINLNISYDKQHKVQLRWSHIADYPEASYIIYRDGVEIVSFKAKEEGLAQNGDSWKSDGSYQYCYDANVSPTVAYRYRVSAKLFDGCVVEYPLDYIVPGPLAPAYTSVSIQGTNKTYLSWSRPESYGFTTAELDIYRNGELLATLATDTNGYLPTYYYDSTVDVLGCDNSYQLRTRFFNGCESELSKPAITVLPTVIKPIISGSSCTANAITLRYSSFNAYGLPYRYEIYRDGVKLSDTTLASYTDASLTSGELHHYAVRLVLADRDYSPLSTVISLSTKLNGVQAALVGSRESLTNPAWLEGDSAMPQLPVFFRIDGSDEIRATASTPLTWYLDAGLPNLPAGIPLKVDADTIVSLNYGDGASTTTEEKAITWKTLDIASYAASPWPLRIRQGDSLLLTVGGNGNASIDAEGDGAGDWQGPAGQKYIHRYDQPGEYHITATLNGEEVGAITLYVVGAEVSREKLWVDTRKVVARDAVITPAPQADSVFVQADCQTGNLSVTTSKVGSDKLRYTVSAKGHDTGFLSARLNAPRGPVLVAHGMEGFACSLFNDAYLPVIRRFPSGEYLLAVTARMQPVRPDIPVTVTVNGYGTIFADNGLASLNLKGSDFSENGFLTVYLVAPATLNPDSASVTVNVSATTFDK